MQQFYLVSPEIFESARRANTSSLGSNLRNRCGQKNLTEWTLNEIVKVLLELQMFDFTLDTSPLATWHRKLKEVDLAFIFLIRILS